MKKNEPPVTRLSNQELDQLIEEMGISYTSENQKNIHDRLQQKIYKQPTYLSQISKWLIAAAVLLILVPGTAIAANSLWEAVTHKDGFLTTLVFKRQHLDDNHYKVEFNYLPTNWHSVKKTELKYYDPNNQNSGLSFNLYKPKKNTQIQIPNSVAMNKEIINNNVVYFIEKVAGSQKSFAAYVAFKEENRIVGLVFGSEVNRKQATKIIEGMSLRSVPAKLAIREEPSDELKNTSHSLPNLQVDNSTIRKFKTSFTQKLNGNCEVRVDPLSVTVRNNIPSDYDLSKDSNGIDQKYLSKLISDQGSLKPFSGMVYQRGDGKKSLDHEIRATEIHPQFYEIKIRITNNSVKDIYSMIINPPNLLLMERINSKYQLHFDYYLKPYDSYNEPTFVFPHGSGPHDYFTDPKPLKVHESRVYKYCYIVMNPMAYKPFLKFDLSGSSSDNLNSSDYSWVELPQ